MWSGAFVSAMNASYCPQQTRVASDVVANYALLWLKARCANCGVIEPPYPPR
jgi:hypothetical protein